VSPPWHSGVDLPLPVLDRTTLGHGRHPWARVATTAQVLGRHVPRRVANDCVDLLAEGTERASVVVVPAELVAPLLQSLDRVSGTVVRAELFERPVTPLRLPQVRGRKGCELSW